MIIKKGVTAPISETSPVFLHVSIYLSLGDFSLLPLFLTKRYENRGWRGAKIAVFVTIQLFCLIFKHFFKNVIYLQAIVLRDSSNFSKQILIWEGFGKCLGTIHISCNHNRGGGRHCKVVEGISKRGEVTKR